MRIPHRFHYQIEDALLTVRRDLLTLSDSGLQDSVFDLDETLLGLRADERPAPMNGRRNRDGRHKENRRSCAALAEPQRRPDKRGEHGVGILAALPEDESRD